ncbi:U3 small nucleolar RNA-associated protein 6 [Kwoniella heveanensis BCC8398]|uniref:U3 small nucleolar RNA-associated protein 6 n=1 Tax=Kwoniella heveanensis BCC8398 TaxID=1296120 RepID=A0A1B9GZF2_9TREE|nr:U3 small nucleolar RNA-associated protein 6 [Kwoniella heveanensis BCC8398]
MAMDKVQFQLEATLPELKDLYEKGLFTKSEINQITKRRTALETSLIRRVTRKEDFFKYAEYEINLERLRKVRWKKLKYHINPPPPSASTYSLPRRALYILKRATVKFPGDLAVWLAYVEYASREGMRKVVGKGLTNALQHHPTSPTLYLLQTYYHLHPGSPFPRESIPSTSKLDLPSASSSTAPPPAFSIEGIDPARTTLLLGLRLLPQSTELWTEYIKLELGWVEALRRRWKLLGIKEGGDSGAPDEEGDEDGDYEGDQDALRGGEGAFGPEGEDARKAILAGQLVVHALNSALEGIPPTAQLSGEQGGNGMSFRQGLINMLRRYPSPLRTKCLSVIYEDLERIAQVESQAGLESGIGIKPEVRAQAKLMLLTKGLYDRPYDPEDEELGDGEIVLEGVELVEELGTIGKEIRKIAKSDDAGKEWLSTAGEWLVGLIGRFDDSPELRAYVSSILASLTKSSLRPPPSLLLSHLALSTPNTDLALARSYASIYPSNPSLQLIKLSAESMQDDVSTDRMCKLCEEAARAVTVSALGGQSGDGDNDDNRRRLVRQIWKMWVQWENAEVSQLNDSGTNEARWKTILKESLKFGSVAGIPDLHADMVGQYLLNRIGARKPVHAILGTIKSSSYQPSFSSYQIVFDGLDNTSISTSTSYTTTPEEWKSLYTAWRGVCRTPIHKADAALAYAGLLVRATKGRGREAYDVIEVVKREVREDGDVERYLEQGWKDILDGRRSVRKEEALPESASVDVGYNDDEDMEGSGSDSDSGSEDELIIAS